MFGFSIACLKALPRLSVIGASLVLGLALPAVAADRITLATSGLNDGQLPYFVAETSKLFAEEGISTERLEFKSGGAAIQAFTGGSADFCICAADHVIRLNNRGIKARILVGLDAHFPNALIANNGSLLTDLPSLKGRKIGITAPGSSTDNIIRWEIARAGLDPERDFELISVGSGVPMLAALKTGAIDAGIVGNGEVIQLEDGPSPPKILIDWRKLEDAALVIIGRQEWVDKNPDLARRFVRAMTRASRLIQTDSAAAERGSREIFPNGSDAFIRKVAQSTAQRLTRDGSVNPDGFRTMTDIVVKSDPETKPVEQDKVDLFQFLSRQ